MSDSIGPITVPTIAPSGTFPLVSRFGFGEARARIVRVHRMGAEAANGKIEQRFLIGDGATRYTYRDQSLSEPGRLALRDFWDARHGPEQPFTYRVPNPDGTFTNRTVAFDGEVLSAEHLSNLVCSMGVTMVAIVDPASAPTYSVTSTCTRFPSGALATALLDQAQEMIPLIRIRVVDAGASDIYLSDRRLTVGGQLYLPRLLRVGDEASDVLLSQSIDGSSDDVQLSFGNADRVMVALANATDLMFARVEIGFFHVGSGIKLDLWAGQLIDWQSDAGPEFRIQCSDQLSALTLSAPVSSCSRTCARRFKLDGCPFSADTRDLTHFPSASLTTCDYGYNTPNGCMAHGVQHSYQAIYATPQTVRILDNSSGTFGIGRQMFGATSQIADNLWGKPLPEIWHDDDGIASRALPVDCLIASGREESDFYIALGAVGAGPLDAYTTPQMYDTDGDGKKETFLGTTLDGQPHHGLKVDSNGNAATGNSTLGLRQALGTDPAGSTDYFSLGRVGSGVGWFTLPDGSPMHEVTGGGSAYYEIFAAGVAFVELRRSDAKGIQLSLPGTHELRTMISGGLTGWTWSSPGSRSSSARLTNPVWVGVNSLLRWVGVANASAAVQETYFDCAAAVAAAAIAETSVARIFGSGSEKQFRFKGVIGDGKPARDWVRDILNCALGYSTWSFGKLRIGLRINASAVSAFTAGNMLWNSLTLTPTKPEFEKLTIEFADEEYLFQANTVEYVDKDYAARVGRAARPREARLRVPGASTKSQAARVAVVRAREELGGVDITEQTAARRVSWKTTLLALDTEAGQVVSITHADVPVSPIKVRVEQWRLNRDFSIDLVGRTVTDSMYEITLGPKPADVAAAPVPKEMPRDQNRPPAPTFGVEVNDLDPLSAEVAGITFADLTNTHTVGSGTFQFFYVDPAAADWLLAANVLVGDASVDLASSPTGIVAGDYLAIGAELLLVSGAPSGTVVPVVRGQLGSTAASATAGDVVAKVLRRVRTVAFAAEFFAGPDVDDWKLIESIPETRLVAVRGWVTNAYGDGAVTDVCVTGNVSHGLPLTSPPPGSTARAIVNLTNGNVTLSAGPTLVNVVATTVDCVVTFAPESSMVGQDVTICLSPGSTKHAICRWASGDTGQGSASDYVVTDPGSSVTFEAS